VIYCDPPYKGTAGYNGTTFDHEAFYAWAERQTLPVFISEYAMPEDRFTCVWSREKRSLFAPTRKLQQEKLYCPKHQARTRPQFEMADLFAEYWAKTS